MPKKLRRNPIYIAPGIKGWIDDNSYNIIDERDNENLNPNDIDDKIKIYERQVKEWFLKPATDLINKDNTGFIILMICISYLEGVEQYRKGENSRYNSKEFFVSAMNRLYPDKYNNDSLENFYNQARCGLFHDGMVREQIIINNNFTESLKFDENNDIKINPNKFLNNIKSDFSNYLEDLKYNSQLRENFNNMYSNI